MIDYTRISIREFARRLNTSDTTIRQAIKSGRIVKGYDPNGGKWSIDFEIALKEWNDNTDIAHRQNRVFGVSDEPKTKTKTAPKQPKEPKQSKNDFDGFGDLGEMDLDQEIDPEMFNKARTFKMIADARINELKLKVMLGELVSKETVNKQLYEAGQTIRDILLTIPDRVIDDILATDNRADAHTLLLTEINRSLNKLVEYEKGL